MIEGYSSVGNISIYEGEIIWHSFALMSDILLNFLHSFPVRARSYMVV